MDKNKIFSSKLYLNVMGKRLWGKRALTANTYHPGELLLRSAVNSSIAERRPLPPLRAPQPGPLTDHQGKDSVKKGCIVFITQNFVHHIFWQNNILEKNHDLVLFVTRNETKFRDCDILAICTFF